MASVVFLESLETKKEKDRIAPFLREFELSCILSDFEEAIKCIPFDTSKYKEKLQYIYNYVRQKVISKLGQKLLVNAYFKSDKNSQESINLLIKKISGESSSSFGDFGEMLKTALNP